MTNGGLMPVRPVSDHDVDRVWPLLRGYIEPATKRYQSTSDMNDVDRHVLNRDRQLWSIHCPTTDEFVGVIVTHTYISHGREFCLVEWAGGDMEVGIAGLGAIESWARDHGMVRRIEGRQGWSRALKKRGYKEVSRTLEQVD